MDNFCRTATFLLLTLLVCTTAATVRAAAPSVFVSVAPQKFFVEQIGGQGISVEVLVGPGQSPATLDPSPKTIARLSSADLYFRTGVPFEEVLLSRFNGGGLGLKIVDVRQGLELLHLEDHGHEHGDGHDAEGEELDPHIWLSPHMAIKQAQVITEALSGANPAGAAMYRENLELLKERLERVDARIAKLLEPFKGREFLVFHPSFGYFAQEYGLVQVAVEHEGKEPGARSMARIVERAKKAGVTAVVTQPQFADRTARTIANALGGDVVKADPLAPDYLENLERIAHTLISAMKAR